MLVDVPSLHKEEEEPAFCVKRRDVLLMGATTRRRKEVSDMDMEPSAY